MELSLSEKLQIRFNGIKNLTSGNITLLHFHIFKNAGSSIKHMLHKNFGLKHIDLDNVESQSSITAKSLKNFLDKQKHIRSVSSHQFNFPFFEKSASKYFTVIFLRDPITRAKSVFDYIKENDPSEYGNFARKYSFDIWIKKSLISAKFATEISNLQAARLLNPDNLNEKISFQNNSCLVNSDEPFKNLNSFDFVGTVEKFEEDCQKMCLKAKEKGLHILSMQKTHKNKSKNENFKQNVIDSLSDESHEMLLHANKYDYRLLESLKK